VKFSLKKKPLEPAPISAHQAGRQAGRMDDVWDTKHFLIVSLYYRANHPGQLCTSFKITYPNLSMIIKK
jgi:hypothetical protein